VGKLRGEVWKYVDRDTTNVMNFYYVEVQLLWLIAAVKIGDIAMLFPHRPMF
jgi:hypothetical protein